MHVKRLFVFICLLFVVGVSQAQRFGLSAGLGYLTTRMYDKDQPNYVVELSGACHLKNNAVFGCGFSFKKSTVIRPIMPVIPFYDRDVYSLFAMAGYDFKLNETISVTPNVDIGISWIEAKLNSTIPYEENERFSPLFGLGCNVNFKLRHFDLFSGISYYTLFDNHQFNPVGGIYPCTYSPIIPKVWNHFCLKAGMTLFFN